MPSINVSLAAMQSELAAGVTEWARHEVIPSTIDVRVTADGFKIFYETVESVVPAYVSDDELRDIGAIMSRFVSPERKVRHRVLVSQVKQLRSMGICEGLHSNGTYVGRMGLEKRLSEIVAAYEINDGDALCHRLKYFSDL